MAEPKIILSGSGFGSVEFPMTAESITFGVQFDLKEYFGYHIATPKWSFHPISLNFLLVAGVGGGGGTEIGGPDSAQDLLDLCQDLVKAGIPTQAHSIREDTCTLRVGTWFVANGYMQNVNCDFGGPWDSTGRPRSANVTLDFQPVIFRRKQGGKDGEWRRVWRSDFDTFGRIN